MSCSLFVSEGELAVVGVGKPQKEIATRPKRNNLN